MERNDDLIHASLGLTTAGLACALVGALGFTSFGEQQLSWTTTNAAMNKDNFRDVSMSAAGGIIALLPAIYWQWRRVHGENTVTSRYMSVTAATTSFVALAYALMRSFDGASGDEFSPGPGWRAMLLACAAAGVAALSAAIVPHQGTTFGNKFALPRLSNISRTRLSAHDGHYDSFPETKDSRRDFISAASMATVAAFGIGASPYAANAAASDVEVPPTVTEYEFPTDWALTGTYDADAKKVLKHMKLGTTLGKGANRMEEFHKNLKSEMIEFVSYYRRFNNVSGKQSFSTLYTAINGYASHITSYGPKFPIPEKRRKRLYQEYVDIERQLKKGR